MLINKIKEDLLTARKNKSTIKVSLLSTLVGESVMVGKNSGNRETNDSEALGVIRKFLKNAEETLQRLNSIGRDTTDIKEEITVLKQYLPQQLETDDLIKIILTMKQENQLINMGQVMKLLKEQYNGLYDAKNASNIVKSVLVS
jgi:uncharacterized protein YqeY